MFSGLDDSLRTSSEYLGKEIVGIDIRQESESA